MRLIQAEKNRGSSGRRTWDGHASGRLSAIGLHGPGLCNKLDVLGSARGSGTSRHYPSFGGWFSLTIAWEACFTRPQVQGGISCFNDVSETRMARAWPIEFGPLRGNSHRVGDRITVPLVVADPPATLWLFTNCACFRVTDPAASLPFDSRFSLILLTCRSARCP